MNRFASHYKVTCHTDYVGPGSTFVVIKGFTKDGRSYIAQALKKGAKTIVLQQGMTLDDETQHKVSQHQAQVEYVPCSRTALAERSAHAYGYPAKSMKLIGITGTKGKTSSAFLAYHMLRTAGHKVALLGTVMNKINDKEYVAPLTTPQPDYLQAFLACCKQEGVGYVIMEVSAQALSLQRLCTLSFDAVAYTNFSQEHAEFYQSIEEYFAAKGKLFELLAQDSLVVLNADDTAVMSSYEGKSTTISMKGAGTIQGQILESTLGVLRFQLKTSEYQGELHSSSLLGEFSAYNILIAIALVQRYGVQFATIKQALASFKGVPGRVESYPLPNGSLAIIDNAHTPSSYEAFFKAARPLSGHLIVIFGAGGDRDATKRPLMGALAARYADEVVLTTDNPRSEDPAEIIEQICQGIPSNCHAKVRVELDRERAIRDAYAKTNKGSLLVLLGKGPVEYQHIQDKKIPFSEKAILASLRS